MEDREWLTRSMLLAGALLLVLGTGRTLADWRQRVVQDQFEPVQLSEPSQTGFVPMIAPASLGLASQQEVDTRPPALSQADSASLASPERARPALPLPTGDLPVRLQISAIGLDAPIVSAAESLVRIESELFYQWQAPGFFAAGWDRNSAPLGTQGNTVLIGHHNIDGEVFRNLHLLQPGNIIVVYGQNGEHRYQVAEQLILKEKYQDLAIRQANARYIEPTSDERLTLVTCWPYVNNTHRLIVIARPIDDPTSGGQPPR